jgi:hypothetical protein
MAATVNSGLYRFFTTAQLDLEKVKYVAAVQQSTAMKSASGGGVVTGGTLNGQTVNFAFPSGVSSLEEWGAIIADAYAQLADTATVATDRAVARFC